MSWRWPVALLLAVVAVFTAFHGGLAFMSPAEYGIGAVYLGVSFAAVTAIALVLNASKAKWIFVGIVSLAPLWIALNWVVSATT